MSRMPFRKRFERLRKASRKTLQEIADEAGFSSRQALHDWTMKVRLDADIERLERIAVALGVAPKLLLGWEGKE